MPSEDIKDEFGFPEWFRRWKRELEMKPCMQIKQIFSMEQMNILNKILTDKSLERIEKLEERLTESELDWIHGVIKSGELEQTMDHVIKIYNKLDKLEIRIDKLEEDVK